jgi:fatty-acyl-CoA synthase
VQEASGTIGELLEQASRFGGSRIAIVADIGERWSYSDLRSRVDAVSRALIALGVEPGDRIGIWMANSPTWIAALLAACSIGAAVVPIGTSMRAGEAESIVRRSGAKWLLAGRPTPYIDLAAEAREVRKQVAPQVQALVLCDQAGAEGGVALDALLVRGEQVGGEVLDDRRQRVSPDQLAVLLYTSGSTGQPKGVMLPQSIIGNAIGIGRWLHVTASDCLVLYLPLFHVFGLVGAMTLLHYGGKLVVMERFDARASLELMAGERATMVYGVSPMYCDQLDHPDFGCFDLSSLRFSLVPAAADLILRVSGRMGVAANVYGMTETASIAAVPRIEDDEERRIQTIGPALPPFEMKVVDPAGQPCEPRMSGELLIRGPFVAPGYWDDKPATAAAHDSDGWFRTGDHARQRPDGYIEYLGRLKDMLKVGGENVDPAEIESVLMQHPAVSQAAVVGVKDRRLDQIPVAFVQLKPGSAASGTELRDHTGAQLAHFKVPRQVLIIDQMPLTGSGKIHKPTLTGWAADSAGEG